MSATALCFWLSFRLQFISEIALVTIRSHNSYLGSSSWYISTTDPPFSQKTKLNASLSLSLSLLITVSVVNWGREKEQHLFRNRIIMTISNNIFLKPDQAPNKWSLNSIFCLSQKISKEREREFLNEQHVSFLFWVANHNYDHQHEHFLHRCKHEMSSCPVTGSLFHLLLLFSSHFHYTKGTFIKEWDRTKTSLNLILLFSTKKRSSGTSFIIIITTLRKY